MIYRFASLLFLVLFFIACRQPKPTAKQYHSEIKVAIDTIIPYFINLDDDIALDSIYKIDKHFKQLEIVVNNSDEFIESKTVFENETVFYDKSKELIHFYREYAHANIEPIIKALEENPDDLNIKEKARISFIQFYEKEQRYLNEFNKASIDFTYKYKIYKIKTK